MVVPALTVALAAFSVGIIEPLLPVRLAHYGATSMAIGIIFTVSTLVYGMSAPVVGRVSEQLPVPRVILLGTIAMAATLPLLAVLQGVVLVCVALSLVNISFAFMLNPASAELGNAVDRAGMSCYSAVYAVYNVCYSIGMLGTAALASTAAHRLTSGVFCCAPARSCCCLSRFSSGQLRTTDPCRGRRGKQYGAQNDLRFICQGEKSMTQTIENPDSLLGALDRGESLPAHWYIDPAITAREIEIIFRKSWSYIGPASELAKLGDYITGYAGEVPVVVIRNASSLAGFINVCRHRRHEVMKGRGISKIMQCGYHAWTYDLTGCLKGAPRSAAEPNFQLADYPLLPLRVESLGPFVFVNLDAHAKSLASYFGDLLNIIARSGVHLESLELYSREEWAPTQTGRRCSKTISSAITVRFASRFQRGNRCKARKLQPHHARLVRQSTGRRAPVGARG